MKNNLKFLTAFALLSMGAINAQTGVGTTDPKATLDVTGTPTTVTTADGIIAPRLTGNQLAAKTAYGADQIAAQVYVTAAATTPAGATVNVTAPGYYYFDGTAWQKVGGGSSKFVDGTTATDAVYTSGKVGIGTTTPDANAALDVTATDKGLLLPRVALTSLLSPAPLSAFTSGMQVYNTATAGTAPNNVTPGVYVADATTWVRQVANVLGSSGDISVEGNSTNRTYIINNTAVTSPKLATSLKVGGGSPSTSSVALEVTGGTKGFVVSTTGNINSITEPVVGMMAYSTTENCLRIYTATGWSNCLLAAAGDASTNGSGIVSTYAAGADKSVTPVYGKRVASTLTTTSSATVGTVGGYNIIASSPTLPGLIFTSTGTFAGTGAQTVTLTANGAIDSAYAGATHTFTSNTTPSFTFTLTVTAMTYVTSAGSTFDALYNGNVDNIYNGTATTVSFNNGEVFSANSLCTGKTISQTSPTLCTGSVTGMSGTVYPLVWINGQCWFAKNLNEVPSTFSAYTATSYIAPGTGTDLGYWGYSNTTVVDGTAGWGTSEPTSSFGNPGLLYQWNAAMNGSIVERNQGSCPTGYHVPSDCEWSYLEHSLGLSVSNQITGGWRGNSVALGSVGTKLKVEGNAISTNNVTGFSAFETGYRNNKNGSFAIGASGNWYWTSTQFSSTDSWYRGLHGTAPNAQYGISRGSYNKADAYAVRCLKD